TKHTRAARRHRGSHGEAGVGGGADELAEDRLVQVGEALEADAASADAGFGQVPAELLGHVGAVLGGAAVEGDVALVAGQADPEPVALPTARVAVVEAAVAGHAEGHGRLELGGDAADQVVQALDVAAPVV